MKQSRLGRYFPVAVVTVTSLIAGICTANIYGHDTVVSVHASAIISGNPADFAILSLPKDALPQKDGTPSKIVVVQKSPEPQLKVGCQLTERMEAARSLLKPIPVSVGKKNYSFTEFRGTPVEFSAPEKSIVLAIMDDATCAIKTTVITQRGDQLISSAEYDIEAITRSNGIQWNNWATEFRVNRPKRQVVIALKYPLVQANSVITPVYYTPYSQELHVPELVKLGEGYLENVASRAYSDLRSRRVPSNAVPGTIVADIPALRPAYIERLAPIEHMDITEFLLDPAWTTERIHIVIGANRERVATYTCSGANACGLMQFTEGTYNLMREEYPRAGLIPNFVEGAKDQFNSMKAALLLHDYNTALLIRSFGKEIISDVLLEEYLAAAYNTGVGRVISVLEVAKRDSISDWAVASGSEDGEVLLNETKGYIAKLRYLRDDWHPNPLALKRN